MASSNCFNNGIFGIEAREEWCTDQGQITKQHHEASNWHVFPETAHLAHILLVMHAENHATCCEEQQGFKECMGH